MFHNRSQRTCPANTTEVERIYLLEIGARLVHPYDWGWWPTAPIRANSRNKVLQLYSWIAYHPILVIALAMLALPVELDALAASVALTSGFETDLQSEEHVCCRVWHPYSSATEGWAISTQGDQAVGRLFSLVMPRNNGIPFRTGRLLEVCTVTTNGLRLVITARDE